MNKMTVRRVRVVAALLLGAAAAVYAGGWTIITLNDFPDHAAGWRTADADVFRSAAREQPAGGLKPALQASSAGGLEVVPPPSHH